MWPLSLFFKFFSNPCPVIYFYWFKRKRERNINVIDRHWLVASHSTGIRDWTHNMGRGSVPWLRIKSTTFWCMGQSSTQLSHTSQVLYFIFKFSKLYFQLTVCICLVVQWVNVWMYLILLLVLPKHFVCEFHFYLFCLCSTWQINYRLLRPGAWNSCIEWCVPQPSLFSLPSGTLQGMPDCLFRPNPIG